MTFKAVNNTTQVRRHLTTGFTRKIHSFHLLKKPLHE